MDVEFRNVKGHIEVYINNIFQFSADTLAEAHREFEQERGNESVQ